MDAQSMGRKKEELCRCDPVRCDRCHRRLKGRGVGSSRRQTSSPLGHLLHALGEYSNSPLAQHPWVRRVADNVLYGGMRTIVRSGKRATKRFSQVVKLMPGDMLKRPRPDTPRAVFDLSLTEEQEVTREMLQRFARDVLLPGAREAESNDDCIRKIMAQTHELGLTAITVPEALGGLASQPEPMSATLIAEDLARGDFSLAVAGLSPLSAATVLSLFATAEQQGRYLPPLADESYVPATIAWSEPRVQFDPHVLHTRAHRSGAHFVIEGRKSLVALAADADVMLVVAQLVGEGPRVFIVEAGCPGVEITRQRTMGLQAAAPCEVVFRGARVPAAALLGDAETWSATAIDELVARANIGVSALSVGTCHAILDYVIEYCNSRVAFGEPISHRQAVAFLIADIAVELNGMRLLVYRAASRAQHGHSFVEQAHLARVQCVEKAMKLASDGLQLLGGHGYVCEHPLERWYRQMRAVSTVDGVIV